MTLPVKVEDNTASSSAWYRGYSGSRLQIMYDANTYYQLDFSPNEPQSGLSYRKTTDQGATWADRVFSLRADMDFDAYYERWTNTGNSPYVHMIGHNDSSGVANGGRGLWYQRLDLSTDTLLENDVPNKRGYNLAVFSAWPNPGPVTLWVSRAGNVHIVAGIANNSIHLKSTDHGVTWTSKTALTFEMNDHAIGMPDGVAADPADGLVFWIDSSAQTLNVSAYDDSMDSWSTTLIANSYGNSAYDSVDVRRNISAAYKRANGAVLLTAWPGVSNPHTLSAWSVSGTTATAMSAVVSNVYGNTCAATITSTGNYRVAYSRDPEGTDEDSARVYYKESTDFSTWGTETAYSTLGTDLQIVHIDSDPSPNVARYIPAYWTDLVGRAPVGLEADIWVEYPPVGSSSTTTDPPTLLRCRDIDGVSVIQGTLDAWRSHLSTNQNVEDSLRTVVIGGTYTVATTIKQDGAAYSVAGKTIKATIRHRQYPDQILHADYEDITVTAGNDFTAAAAGGVEFTFTPDAAKGWTAPYRAEEESKYVIQFYVSDDDYYPQLFQIGCRRGLD